MSEYEYTIKELFDMLASDDTWEEDPQKRLFYINQLKKQLNKLG